ncbi:MAG: 2-hydroxymethylglutarate dehydrogenase [Ilumatobacteraceae bacterium]|jgi:3-hydroxyisobutyrate dehydrogenase-like beta-hydroxyacid dehydrogenase
MIDGLPTTVGLIGLGNMGLPMATNMVAAGLELVVYDVNEQPMSALAELGAAVAGSPREVGERCDIIGTVVVDDAQVEDVLLGSNDKGVLHGARPGSVIIIHSTVRPETCVRLATLAAARGVDLLDAPVSGGAYGARAGTLSVMVGGKADVVGRCRAVFDAIGSHWFHMGEVGMGQIAKIVNNHISLVTREAVREGLRVATLAGINEQRMLEVARASSADSFTVRNWEAMEQEIAGHPGGPAVLLNVAYKDLQLALSVGHRVGASLPLAAVASQVLST